jgi:uncharacterized repeat protein (TIGR01451 family)
MLGLTVRAEPVGVAPGEMVTLTLTLENPTGTALTGVSISTTLPDSLRRIPAQADWAYDAREKRLHAGVETPAAGTSVTLTLALRAAGPVDTLVPVTFEAVSGAARATATAEVWIVQPGRARVTPEDGTEYRFGYQDETAGGDSRESAWWMVTTGCDGSPQFRYTNWRWNVDQIADAYGNIVRVDYRRETNDFRFTWPASGYYDRYYYSGLNPCAPDWECWRWEGEVLYREHWMANSGYVRGGSLEQVTYSWPDATHKVVFQVAARTDYPTAFDSGQQTQLVQTFWSKERLQVVEVRSNGQSQVVRRYELSAGYDEDGRLRLQGVQEVAADGTRLPAMTFGYLRLAGYSGNCMQGESEEGYKPWLVWISTGYGGSIGFGYTEWPGFQNGQIMGPKEGEKCWYRYRVRRVTVNPDIGPEMHSAASCRNPNGLWCVRRITIRRTRGLLSALHLSSKIFAVVIVFRGQYYTVYEYRTLGDTAHSGSWQGTEFRGHPKVRVLHLDREGTLLAYTDHYFHQGLGQSTASGICGGDVADANGLQGREYKRVQYDGSGNALAMQTTRWQVSDLGGGRRFVAPVAVCAYPNGGSGPYSRSDYAYPTATSPASRSMATPRAQATRRRWSGST